MRPPLGTLSGSQVAIGSSSVRRPSSTSWSTTTAVNILLTLAIRIGVSGAIARPGTIRETARAAPGRIPWHADGQHHAGDKAVVDDIVQQILELVSQRGVEPWQGYGRRRRRRLGGALGLNIRNASLGERLSRASPLVWLDTPARRRCRRDSRRGWRRGSELCGGRLGRCHRRGLPGN